jgi:hypothetical protein
LHGANLSEKKAGPLAQTGPVLSFSESRPNQ